MTYLSHTTSALFETLRFKSPLFLLLALLISFPALAAKKPIQIPSGKPEIFDLDPRGIQEGHDVLRDLPDPVRRPGRRARTGGVAPHPRDEGPEPGCVQGRHDPVERDGRFDLIA